MIIIIADAGGVATLLDLSDKRREPEIIRPQTSGPCVHYGPYGCEVPREDGQCPHLDNTSIVCPIKDVLGAAQAYAPAEPEFVEPAGSSSLKRITRMQEWTAEEDAAIRDATTAAESVPLYRSAVPDSGRSDAAIRAQWYIKVRPGLCEARDPLPDFDGDVAPVTQCEEPVFLPGDRVRLVDNPDMVGEVVYVATNGRYASVQFPGPGPATVCAIDSIEGVGA